MKWLKGCMVVLLVCMPAFVSAQECVGDDPSDEMGSELSSPDGEYVCRQALGEINCYAAKKFEPGVKKQHAVRVYAYVCGNDGNADMVRVLFRNSAYSGFRIGNTIAWYRNRKDIFSKDEAQELKNAFKQIWESGGLPDGAHIFFFDRHTISENTRHLAILKGIHGYLKVSAGLTYTDAINKLVEALAEEKKMLQSAGISP